MCVPDGQEHTNKRMIYVGLLVSDYFHKGVNVHPRWSVRGYPYII